MASHNFFMAHAEKMGSFSNSTKVALGIIVVVAIIAFFYYEPLDLSPGGLKDIGDGLGDVFSGEPTGEPLNFTMTSSVSFLTGEMVLEDATVELEGVHVAETSVGDSLLDDLDGDATVGFTGFNGRMSVLDGALSVDGTAESVISEGARIKPKQKRFDVASSVVPDSYSIDPVTIPRIRLVKVFGSIERVGDEGSTTRLANSTIEIDGFQGSMTFDGRNYVITGSAVEVKGKSFTLKG